MVLEPDVVTAAPSMRFRRFRGDPLGRIAQLGRCDKNHGAAIADDSSASSKLRCQFTVAQDSTDCAAAQSISNMPLLTISIAM
ncbi:MULTISPECIES: hypothetical protein [Nocardia]|uniref:hypothetical protein n=1 Tax=Nocardia TaxID=1817 RepID=UPI0013002351|nr:MULTISPECIES: hypothetical protein [Nocardia]